MRLVRAVLVVLLCLVVSGAVTAASAVTIVVNGRPVTTDVPPQIIDGRVMVPIRFVSEALGATVSWDASQRTVVVSGGGGTGIPNGYAIVQCDALAVGTASAATLYLGAALTTEQKELTRQASLVLSQAHDLYCD